MAKPKEGGVALRRFNDFIVRLLLRSVERKQWRLGVRPKGDSKVATMS